MKQSQPITFRVWVAVILLHFGLTLLMTWPAIIQVNESVFGGPRGDKWVFIWNFWWFKYSLFKLHQAPIFTDMLYYPTGTSLALHDMNYIWSLLSIPLQSLLSLTTIFNIFMIFCFLLNGLSLFVCAYKITGSIIGAMIGSILFAYCPYFIGRFSVSHLSLLSAFFIPPFLLMLWQYNEKRQMKHLAFAGIFISLTTLCHLYYGTILILLLLFFGIYQFIVERKFFKPPKVLGHLIWSFLIIGISLAPLLVPIVTQIAQGNYKNYSTQDYKYLEESSADLSGYFVPDFTIAEWRGYSFLPGAANLRNTLLDSTSGNPLEKTVFPGTTSWFFLLAAFILPAIRKRFWPWIFLSLFFFIWTLGPTLYIKGQPYLEGLLPLRLLYSIPILNLLRMPSRFSLFIPLSTGIIIAAIIAHISKRNLLVSWIVAATVFLWIILEFIPKPQLLIPKQIFFSPFYNTMRHDPREYGVLNIPVDFFGERGGGDIFQYAQTIHEKPIVGGYISRTPIYAFETRNNSPFIQAVEHHEYGQGQILHLNREGFDNMPKTLNKLNLRYVIVHRPLVSESEWLILTSWLEKGLGFPTYEDQWIRVYNGFYY